MSEHAPISDYDAAAIELFLMTEGAQQRSPSGGEIEWLQTYGVAALEDYENKRAANAQLRRELQDGERFRRELLGLHLTGDERTIRAERMAAVEHLAGRSIAAQPWNLLEPTALPGPNEGPYGDAYREPGFAAEEKRALASRRRRRMAEQGRYGLWLVLETYFGAVGRRFDEASLPRVYALLHLVKPGRDLLEAAQPLLKRNGAAPDRMRWLCLVIDHETYAPHRELFERACLAGDRLYREAAQAWLAAKGAR